MLSIVVPTYLEAENIPPLITGIFDSLNEIGISYEVIIVDDNSTDGTVEIIKRLNHNNKYKVVLRKKS